ncbi:hypothetical protein ACFVXG_20400 [Kitasatospora sp. NPDC058162]|uniref:hypothetical protein n=1 Tax=Kitasatospora sp. NPDC058162 TaxID=3346362 RepID=UPI0036DEC8BE
MSMTVIARYATAGGATVEVQRNALFGLLDTSYDAWCTGCDTAVTAEVNPNVLGGIPPQEDADGWAREHAATCRRIPA